MEPILSKLQEGVKYPRFERDATKTINDLVDHITKERGVYSSSIEPNPNEHSVWFNTDTNTLMIYNNHVWRDFSGSGSSSGWNVENALLYTNEKGNLAIGNIKDKTFYILDVDVESVNYIEMSYLSDDIEFYIFISSMPERLYFPNSNIITNYDTIVRHTTGNNIVGMSVLAHKVGITVKFSIINDKTDASNKNYVYNTKAESALLPFIGQDNNMHYITKNAIENENNLNQIEALLPSNVSHKGYINGTLCVSGDTQIVYSPFLFPIDDILPIINTVVFKNVNNSNIYNAVSIHSSTNKNQTSSNVSFTIPYYAIFDKFNYNNLNKICKINYPLYVNADDGAAIIIRDNWEISNFIGLNEDYKMGIDILIDDFVVNRNTSILLGNNCISNVIINNRGANLYKCLMQLAASTSYYKPNGNSTLSVSDICDKVCTIIFTTNYKYDSIYIPKNRSDYDNPLFIILPNKIEEFTIVTYNKIAECGNTVIVTIPDNYDIINNYSSSYTDNKPISELDNIHINTTLNVDSNYDEKGLSSENYHYTYNNEYITAYFERTDTPLIG